MSTSGQSTVTVALSETPPVTELEAQWRQLESLSEASYFTTWSWIGCWLQGLEPHRHVQLLRATRNGQTVGLGLLVGHAGKRLKMLASHGLHLHSTGDQIHDDLTVEHNGMLVHRDGEGEVVAAMYEHLLSLQARWDRLVLPGLSASLPLRTLLAKHRSALREEMRPSYYVDLQAVRKRDNDYLGMLGASTRSQIRRSLKAYGELGPVTLSDAPDLDTALAYLDGLQALHQRHWQQRGKPGAFANPRFNAFHTRQIAEGFALGHIQMLRVQAGERDIGYLYNFVHRGRVLFYQSGFDYELIEKHGRPGLVAHALGVQHNARLGHAVYDFLAGDTRYKQSLSSGMQPMTWATIHRDTWAFRLEDKLRRVKQELAARQAEQAGEPDDKREPLKPYPLVAAGVLAVVQAFTPSSLGEASPTLVIEDTSDTLEPFQPRRPMLGFNW